MSHCKGTCQFHTAGHRYSNTSGYCSECDEWVLVNKKHRRCPCCNYYVRRHKRNRPPTPEVRA